MTASATPPTPDVPPIEELERTAVRGGGLAPDPVAGNPLLVRSRQGGWLGGVCAGISPPRALKVGWVRLAFVLATLLGGLGLVAYAALWLILPEEGDATPGSERRGLVVMAQACAACAGIGVLALGAATATIFGLGWVVVAVAAMVLALGLTGWHRLGPTWVLPVLLALTLPAVGALAGGLRLSLQSGQTIVRPSALSSSTYSSGLGTLMVDLRRTRLPASGTASLNIEAGVRRTIVALPHDGCVRVQVSYHVSPFLGRLAALLSSRIDRPFSQLILFGQVQTGTVNRPASASAPAGAPLLRIRFNSMGGSLYVRDYPTSVDPETSPDWPGYTITPEPRPDTAGLTRRAASALLRGWQARLRIQLRQQRTIAALMPGPCSTGLGGGQ